MKLKKKRNKGQEDNKGDRIQQDWRFPVSSMQHPFFTPWSLFPSSQSRVRYLTIAGVLLANLHYNPWPIECNLFMLEGGQYSQLRETVMESYGAVIAAAAWAAPASARTGTSAVTHFDRSVVFWGAVEDLEALGGFGGLLETIGGFCIYVCVCLLFSRTVESGCLLSSPLGNGILTIWTR